MNRRILLVSLALSCGTEPTPLVDLPGVSVRFGIDLVGSEDFYATPYPADHRRIDGAPPLSQMPGIDATPLLEDLANSVADVEGYPVVPVAWFGFDGRIAAVDLATSWAASPMAAIQLVDIDPDSPDQGRRIPVVASILEPDRYVEGIVLAVAPVPGFVLRADNTYAFLIRRDLGDADGNLLGVRKPVRQLLRGDALDETWDPLVESWNPLVELLPTLALEPDDLAGATVFTTGDVVADVETRSNAVLAATDTPILDVSLHATEDQRPGYCELRGTLALPQYQRGTPPFSSDGAFEYGDDGLPRVQRTEDIPVVITIPATEMPADGYPIALYFHGSGGRSDQVVARSPRLPTGDYMPYGHGPAWVLAEQGIAAAGSAHPLNPERVEGASAFAYLNLTNLVVFRDTFQQGIIEQRMYLDALLDLRLSTDDLADCTGASLPAGTTEYRLDPEGVVAMGQSMGGMYVNLVSAVDPRITAVVPTGAGGHWSRMGLATPLFGTGGTATLISALLKTDADLNFLHPAMHIVQTSWAAAEPLAYLPRLAARPLPGHPARDIYEPVGLDDIYFPTEVFDSMALAYGTELSGDVVWPSMESLLELDGRTRQSYPVFDNRLSENGEPYTAAVTQYRGDGLADPHVIFVQLDEVRTQYGCFFRTHLDGETTVVDPDVGCLQRR